MLYKFQALVLLVVALLFRKSDTFYTLFLTLATLNYCQSLEPRLTESGVPLLLEILALSSTLVVFALCNIMVLALALNCLVNWELLQYGVWINLFSIVVSTILIAVNEVVED